ncbi:MAG: sigma-70 family RNA polymerase sigma factor [Candidatus Hydrogenedentes bacterium]|nr:sigma-70 family RNA polymerase sigma factor [Candidatus Hydrogenedentota bacterium]
MVNGNEADRRQLDDETLALALQAGDDLAFAELVHRHQGRVYAVAYRVTSNREDALDVAQEAFIRVYRKINAWRPTGNFLSWLLRLTTNLAIDMLRKQRRRQVEPLEDRTGREPLITQSLMSDTARQAGAQEIAVRVESALTALSPMQRTVFVLRHYEGLQLADIAKALGCTVGSVKVHLFRALKKLQQELADLHER